MFETDEKPKLKLRARIRRHRSWLQLLAFIAVAAAAIISYSQAYNASHDAKDAVARIERETKERRGQICLSFETTHLNEVQQLSDTYRFLRELPEADKHTSLTKAIVQNLPMLEKNAKSDQDSSGIFVPTYCDAPNVGLPEPDPIPPQRPKEVDDLVVSVLGKDASTRGK